MNPSVTITVDAERAAARIAQPLVLGNTYAVTFAGLSDDAAAASPEVIVLGCVPGEIAARSDADGNLAMNTVACASAFRRLPPPPFPPLGRPREFPVPPPTPTPPVHGAARPHGSVRLHFYVVADGVTLAQGDLALLWAPFAYDEAGEPIQLQGKKGDKGDPGDKGDKGEPGRNGVYVPMEGLYAFHVSDQGDHEEDGHLWIHAQDDSTLYAQDANGNYLLDENNEKIPLYYVDADGHLKYRFFHGDANHAELDLGRVVTRTGLYALHVADGTVAGEIAGHLYLHGQDLSELYATNAQGERILDPETGEPIPLFSVNASGHLIYTIYTASGEVHATLDIGDVRGPKGDALTFDDLTEQQKAALKGAPGDKGDPGDALTWDDLTEEQKAALKGQKGDPGAAGLTEEEIRQIVESQMDHGAPDDAPTAGSKAWVTSGGLWSVEQAIIARINAIQARYGSTMSYRGTVPTVSDLPAENLLGDVYNVDETGDNYAWNGAEWDKLSGVVDLSAYALKSDIPAVVVPSTDASAAGKAADAKATADALAGKMAATATGRDIQLGQVNGAPVGSVTACLVEADAAMTRVENALETTRNARNLLDYATSASGVVLAPLTAVYRSALNADGTFPTVDATAIPTAAAYYQFELELAVPSTVPASITGPSGWVWLDGHGLPDPADLSGGETICISVRLDCTARTFLASVWRVA